MITRRATGAALALLLAAVPSCKFVPKKVKSTLPGPPSPAQLAELWREPTDIASRDLFHGPGGPDLVPDPTARYDFVKKDISGFSRGWDVRDERGMVWSVKIGLEAQTETTASRIVWAAGYHQPPTYYVRDWKLTGSAEQGPQYSGRFRPHLPWMKKADNWSFHQNPFVGTREYKGLLVLMVIINNWDLLPQNAVIYELDPPRDGVRRWYVVRDLGASFGKTSLFPQGTRNDLEGFEKEGFILGVSSGRVKFAYRGRHRELFHDITPADVRWICDLLGRLSRSQWEDAFRAGGFDRDKTERYVRKIEQKIEQGRRLGG